MPKKVEEELYAIDKESIDTLVSLINSFSDTLSNLTEEIEDMREEHDRLRQEFDEYRTLKSLLPWK